ncbi:MAG: hypothetical protein V3V67_10620 [Myxococcota bacterium]
MLPPRYLCDLIDLREALADQVGSDRPLLGEQDLHAFEEELRQQYMVLAEEVSNPVLPQFLNTDGEPIELTRVHFRLRCSPERAFRALHPLAVGTEPAEFLSEARRDAGGRLRSVHLDWLRVGNSIHPDWHNTILGNIDINRARLIVEVNSARRADLARCEVESRLGSEAVFLRREVAPVELGESADDPRQSGEEGPVVQIDSERVVAGPDREQVRAQLVARHRESWLETSLPALRGQTPREAARCESGHERLEALLAQMEWDATDADDLAQDAKELRRMLGLSASGG